MPSASLIQTNFTAGEFSPRLMGQVDFDRYSNGCATLRNMIVDPMGGAFRRSGLQFIREVKSHSRKVRLIEFEFSVEQAYILEFGHQYIRVYKDGGVVESAPGTPVEIATTYQESELFDIKFTQSADVLYLVHPAHPPRTLSRSSHTAWAMVDTSFTAPPSDWSTGNYPSTVQFFEQRLLFAGVPSKPNKIYASKPGDYDDFTFGDGTAADDAWSRLLISNSVNATRWLNGTRNLMVGTAGNIWTLPGKTDEPLTASTVRERFETGCGCRNVQPVQIGERTVFLDRTGRRMMDIGYNFQSDSYTPSDLSILGEHLTRERVIVDMAYAAHPHSVLWCVCDDGMLLGLTYFREHNVYAWHLHSTSGEVESVASIPNDEGDEVWCVVRRTVGGVTKRYVERLAPEFIGHDLTAGRFMDSWATYNGAPATTVTGLGHLAGHTVQVLADGYEHPDVVVSDTGTVALQAAASEITFGLGYTSELQTLGLQGGAPDGTSEGRVKRVVRVTARIDRTPGFEVGTTVDDTHEVAASFGTGVEATLPLFTGDFELKTLSGRDRVQQVYIRQRRPLPLYLLAIMSRVEVTGG